MTLKKLIYILNFTLSLLTAVFAQEVELPEITLVIEKPVAEKKIVFTQEEIREKNVESLSTLLESAGIQILSYGPYGLESKPSIRGFTDETVRVIIDGICVNNEQYGTFDFTSIDISSIEKIEIVKGGFTEGVSDEGAVGGAIYITTKNHSSGRSFFSDSFVKTFFNSSMPLDTFGEKIDFSSQLGDSSFLKLAADLTFANNRYFYLDDFNQSWAERKNAQVLDGSGNLKFTRYFGGGNSFSAGELFYAGDKSTPGSTGGNSGKQQDYDNNLTLNLKLPSFLKDCNFEGNLCWLSNTRFYKSVAEDSRHFVNSIKFSAEGEYSGFDFYNQKIGLTLGYTNLNSTNDGKHTQFTGTIKETAKFNWGGTFSFSVPLAVKFCNENSAFIPKFGTKAAFEYFDVTADVYRMVQFPNMDDLYWEGDGYQGNPDLKVEEGWGGEIGLALKNLPVSGDVTFFTNYYKNKIQWASSGSGWKPQNVASAFYAGADLSLGTDLFNKKLSLKCNVEYLYNRLLDKSNEVTYGKKIMWTPDWTAGFSAMVNMEKFNLNLEGNFTGSRFTSNSNIYSMDPYFLVNASGQLKVWDSVTPYFRIDNLLNVMYEAVEDYPMPGISLTFGVKINVKKD